MDQLVDALKEKGFKLSRVEHTSDGILFYAQDLETQLSIRSFLHSILGSRAVLSLNLVSTTPQWLQSIGAEPMRLGLDLRGGVHFLLQVDFHRLIQDRLKSDGRSMMRTLRNNNIHYSEMNLKNQGMVFMFRDAVLCDRAFSLLQSSDYVAQKTENNDGTWNVDLTLNQTVWTRMRQDILNQNLNILRARVLELNIQEALIQQQGPDSIGVDLPGVQDLSRAKNLIGKMATIRIQLVDTEHDARQAQESGIIPAGSELIRDAQGHPFLLKTGKILSGSAIVHAATQMDENGRPAVLIDIKNHAVAAFHAETARHINEPLATIYIETKPKHNMESGHLVLRSITSKKVINVAVVREALANRFQITGLDSIESAQNLSLLLRSGAYSAPMHFLEERVIGPSLGKENIEKGLLSLKISACVVIIFMVIYYGFFGFIADCALILNLFFIVALFSVLGGTLSLPGIAGIVLTIGMAVDSNVLINERIREELRRGMSAQVAIARGYDRAFTTILDSNCTTVIVAIILWALGSSQIQNLAEMLIIGIFSSMITAVFVTRSVVYWIYSGRSTVNPSIGIRSK